MAISDWFADAVEQVKAAGIQPPSTKAEAVAYYQRTAPGTGKHGTLLWKQRLIHDLLPFTTQTGKDPAKNLAKRFDPQRLHNPEPRNASQYKALGALIGVKPPKYGYHISFDGWINFSAACSLRSFSVDVTGEWAAQLSQEPALFQQAMLLLYMEEDDQDRDLEEQEPSVGLCEDGDDGEAGEAVEDPDIRISANQREVASGHNQERNRRFSFFS